MVVVEVLVDVVQPEGVVVVNAWQLVLVMLAVVMPGFIIHWCERIIPKQLPKKSAPLIESQPLLISASQLGRTRALYLATPGSVCPVFATHRSWTCKYCAPRASPVFAVFP